MNRGTGASANRVSTAVELSTTCTNPAPPMKTKLPIRLAITKERATGTPSAIRAITIPSKKNPAVYHSTV